MRQSAEQFVAIDLKAVQADADDLNAALAAQAHYGKAAPNGNLGFSEPRQKLQAMGPAAPSLPMSHS
jgi:hypothetical protein